MLGSMVVLLASFRHGSPGSIPQSSKIFSPLWIAPAIIPGCERSIPEGVIICFSCCHEIGNLKSNGEGEVMK